MVVNLNSQKDKTPVFKIRCILSICSDRFATTQI